MSWKNQLKKGIATATRSAELWAMNDYDVYQNVVNWIKEKARSGRLDKDEIFNELTKYLPEIMAHLDGFMEELTERDPSDGLSDVDWVAVAEGYEPEIEEQIAFFAE
tara:strand:- start:4964 stop:5284 length:321 start_codon:yes stop_codon:yes gene_type:complete